MAAAPPEGSAPLKPSRLSDPKFRALVFHILASLAVAGFLYYIVSNTLPAITSNGGNATASIFVAENTSVVTTVTATDPEAL